jgi:hypothetical protein
MYTLDSSYIIYFELSTKNYLVSQNLIYEIDVITFTDSDEDGIGNIEDIENKLGSLEKNPIKLILLRSPTFCSK